MNHSINAAILSSVALAMLELPAHGQIYSNTSGQTTSTSRQVRASQLIGMSAQNAQGEKLGEVQDLIVDPQTGEVRLAILGKSTVSGLTDRLIPVPWQVVTPRADNQIVVSIDTQRFQTAPNFASGDYNNLNTPDYLTRVYTFYNTSPASGSATSSWSRSDQWNTRSPTGSSGQVNASERYNQGQSRYDDDRYAQRGRYDDERYGQSSIGATGSTRSRYESDRYSQDTRYDSGRYAQDRRDDTDRYGRNSRYDADRPRYDSSRSSDYDSDRSGQSFRYDSDRYNDNYRSDAARYGQGSSPSSSYGTQSSSYGQRFQNSGAYGQSDYDPDRYGQRYSGRSEYRPEESSQFRAEADRYRQSPPRYESDRYNQGYRSDNDRYNQNYTQSNRGSYGQSEYDSGRSGQGYSGQSGYSSGQDHGPYSSNQWREDDRYRQSGSYDRDQGGSSMSNDRYTRFESDRYDQRSSGSRDTYDRTPGSAGYSSYSGSPYSRYDDDRYSQRSNQTSSYGRFADRSDRAENFRGTIRDIDPRSRTMRVEAYDGRTMQFRVDRGAVLMANGQSGADLNDFRQGQQVQIGFRDEGGERRALSVADLENRYQPLQR